ncbi:MAG: 50S ribosomal protein L6 [Candidatus Harrisonbacteria bacterium CG10_big_fil_rev_8_21_14_0_10_42_17]|uniref:Large ribosomal subunit protein uL6 n=1 Tax=Candidatus Harrisonbacteria bacterium CG10_big_fil_rev_8_21_14_0_10_42_17 TaxID=1974584 RepID=A0A2M6WHM9_9BACT|nr:MAG: 50S ribosomal protein L6 [Candidatus Harrisonbacteria bacterium CG10_big_fil_rev_8_21_14_0_10_42_17]
MSKLGKKPIPIPSGVTVTQTAVALEFKGPQGSLLLRLLPYVSISIQNNEIHVTPLASHKQARSNFGTIAALIKNALSGVVDGFSKSLLIEGVGYRVALEGKTLVLNVGFSHSIRFPIPDGITATVDKNSITLVGIDKILVGQVAATIRKIKKPEPYKGKGIRYSDEVVQRKAGKKAAGATA